MKGHLGKPIKARWSHLIAFPANIDELVEFGIESWELDALDPATLTLLIESAIQFRIDWDRWAVLQKLENEQRSQIKILADNFDHAVRLMKDEDE